MKNWPQIIAEVSSLKTICEFTVPGQPIGYYAQAARSLFKMSQDQRRRAEQYRSYQDKVKIYALQAGLRSQPSAGQPFYVVTVAYFSDGRHSDPSNIQKGICDSLFKQDRYTGGLFLPPMYDKTSPRVEILILCEK